MPLGGRSRADTLASIDYFPDSVHGAINSYTIGTNSSRVITYHKLLYTSGRHDEFHN